MAFNEQILEGFRPNIFELMAQETMSGALRPAVDYLLRVRTRCVSDSGIISSSRTREGTSRLVPTAAGENGGLH